VGGKKNTTPNAPVFFALMYRRHHTFTNKHPSNPPNPPNRQKIT
jgi:hypothetical protein